MRFSHINHLIKLFFMYFFRKVLSVGVLKNPLFKILFGISIIVILFAMSALMHGFFIEIGNKNQEVDLILKVYTTTITIWTIIAFIFLKILFAKSDKLLKITMSFPVNMKERNLALLIFEVFMTFCFICMISLSITIALLLLFGVRYLGMIICNIFYLSATLYLVMQLFYSLIGWSLEKLKLSKIKNPILFLIYTTYFLIFFHLSAQFSSQILVSYLNKENAPKYFVLIWDRLNNIFGFGITTLIFFIVISLLIFILIYIPDYAYLQKNIFNKLIHVSKPLNYLSVYFLALFRRTENTNLVIIAYLFIIYLIYAGESNYLLWPIFIFCVNGIYLYIQTEEIRFLQFKIGYSVWNDYLTLLVSQLMWGGMFSLPIIFLFFLTGNGLGSFLYMCSVYLFSVVMFTMIGILFPPKKENPFSVFLSFAIILTFFSVIVLALFILQLPELWNKIVIAFVFFASILISIQGLIKLKEEFQNEKTISFV